MTLQPVDILPTANTQLTNSSFPTSVASVVWRPDVTVRELTNHYH